MLRINDLHARSSRRLCSTVPATLPGFPVPTLTAAVTPPASFADPDGNEWILQQVTERLPGR
jgi:hypothetical protein